jgi:arylsulfatase A-like enzyme
MRRGISGTHRMNGIFIAHGATIRAGGTVEGASLVDLAPTILALMGEAVPAHMDGRVLSEILASDEELAVRSQAAAEADAQGDAEGFGHTFSDEEKRLLAERLRSLGYVG